MAGQFRCWGEHRTDSCWKKARLKIHTNRIWNAGKQHYPKSYYPAPRSTLMSLCATKQMRRLPVLRLCHRHNSSSSSHPVWGRRGFLRAADVSEPTKTCVTFVTDLCRSLNQWEDFLDSLPMRSHTFLNSSQFDKGIGGTEQKVETILG